MNIDFDKLDEQGLEEVRDILFSTRLKIEGLRKRSNRRHPTAEQMDVIRALRDNEDSEVRMAYLRSDFRQSRESKLAWETFRSTLLDEENPASDA